MGTRTLVERNHLTDELGKVKALQDVVNDVLRDHRREGSRETGSETTWRVHSYV